MQCNHCNKVFRGRAHRANCHVIGKIGVGVEICRVIPQDVKAAFISRVFPELVKYNDLKLSAPKKVNQGSMSSFVSLANFKLSAVELGKFVNTFGISFNAFRNPHLQKPFDAVAQGFQVPSKHRLEGPALISEDEDVTALKNSFLNKDLLTGIFALAIAELGGVSRVVNIVTDN